MKIAWMNLGKWICPNWVVWVVCNGINQMIFMKKIQKACKKEWNLLWRNRFLFLVFFVEITLTIVSVLFCTEHTSIRRFFWFYLVSPNQKQQNLLRFCILWEEEWPLFVRCDRTTDWWWGRSHLFILKIRSTTIRRGNTPQKHRIYHEEKKIRIKRARMKQFSYEQWY